jgi:hypothetical protein
MRYARWTAPLLGLAVAAAFALPATAAAPAQSSTNQEIFAAGLINSQDVPSTWTSSKQTDTLEKTLKSIPACKALAAASDKAKKISVKKLSPHFTDPSSTNTGVDDIVQIFKSPSGAQALLAAFQAPSSSGCFTKAFQKVLAKAAKGVKVAVNIVPIDNLQGVGDGATGYEGAFTISKGSQQVTLIGDYVGVQVGRTFTGFSFTNQDKTIPNGLDLINTVVDRLKPVAS